MKYTSKTINPIKKMTDFKKSGYKLTRALRKVNDTMLTPLQLLKKKMRQKKHLMSLQNPGDRVSTIGNLKGAIRRSSEFSNSEADTSTPAEKRESKLARLNLEREKKGLPALTAIPLK